MAIARAEHAPRRELLAMLLTLQAQERFEALRTNRSGGWRGFSGLVPAKELGDSTIWQLTTEGQGLFNGQRARKPRVVAATTSPDQLPVSRSLLRFRGRRPVWDAPLVQAIRALPDTSPGGYPHSALDVVRACDEFVTRKPDAAFAVWSSISPWLEVALLRWQRASVGGTPAVTTVDWNEPIIEDGAATAAGGELRTMDASALAAAYARGKRFDLIVSFSGLEHDGLGRYGDPLHPEGDLAAMAEIRAFLVPRGLLLLGIPTNSYDDICWPNMRVYGPSRLPRMLEGFEMVGRVWNGSVVHGGLEANQSWPPLLAHEPKLIRWQHQHVLVLRRAGDDEANGAHELMAAEREARLRRVRSRLEFGALRRTYPGWSTASIEMRNRMPPEIKAAYAPTGFFFASRKFLLGDAVAARLARHATAILASSVPLGFDGRRPIWNDELLRALEGETPRGPSRAASSDLPFVLRGAGIDQLLGSAAAIAVVSGLVPIAELQLLKTYRHLAERGGRNGAAVLPLTCIGWSAPAVRGHNAGRLFRPLDVAQLAERYAEGKRFDMLISVSGALARDGLGLWGDPLHPDGDIVSMREYQRLLTSAGTLIITVPVAARDDIADWPTNDFGNATTWRTRRVYGPVRLPRLLQGYRLFSCMVNGVVVPLLRRCIASNGLCTEGDWNSALSALRVEQEWTFVMQSLSPSSSSKGSVAAATATATATAATGLGAEATATAAKGSVAAATATAATGWAAAAKGYLSRLS